MLIMGKADNYLRRKAQSEIFDRVLNAPLMSQTENFKINRDLPVR